MAERVFLIDGSGYVYRAYFARGGVAHLTTSKGEPTGAVFVFTRMLLKLLREQKPKYIAVAFDKGRDTFRREIYPEYKANRPEPPPELIEQAEKIKKVVEAFNIPVVERDGFEADDLIGSLARKLKEQGFEVVIVTGDKDFCQLVDEHTTLYDSLKDVWIDVDGVKQKFGVEPSLVVDVLALAGDKSDNIPGVPGIGEKSAQKIVAAFGDIENVIANADKLPLPEKRRNAVKEHAESARLSKRLAAIRTDLEVDIAPEHLKYNGPDANKIIPLFKELEFFSLIPELPQNDTEQQSQRKTDLTEAVVKAKQEYQIVRTEAHLREVLERCRKAGTFAFDLETTSLKTTEAEVVGVALAWDAGKAAYIPVAHRTLESGTQLDRNFVLQRLADLLKDSSLTKVAHNIKYDIEVLHRAGFEVGLPFEDTMLVSYVLDSATRSHSLDALVLQHTGHRMITYKEVAGTGKKQVSFDQVAVETAAEYASEDADYCLRLFRLLRPALKTANLEKVYTEIELPLVPVLCFMEETGVKLDTDKLKALGQEIANRLRELEQQIWEIAGVEFNINSPQQLGEVLFERLKLPHGRKTRKGAWSTDQDVLEKLSEHHPLPALVLEYRALAKLKNTYIDSLVKLVDKRTGRVHTSYNQAVTTTGRLSSSEPNLQNIPVRTELGRRIRSAFVAEEGFVLLSADYSQIELRLLAHITNDENLKRAFIQGEDIHTRTASEVFGIPPEAVDAETRRRAKTINFGIVYGMSAHGLAQELGISRTEARQFIETYFERYPKVKEYMERTVKEARKNLCVYTLWGRRVPVPDINSRHAPTRQNAERAAINAPIQGSAADLIKRAMVQIFNKIKNLGLRSRLIMQVHDELVFEVPEDEIDKMKELAKNEMEKADSGLLSVPLVVEVGVGKNWTEAH